MLKRYRLYKTSFPKIYYYRPHCYFDSQESAFQYILDHKLSKEKICWILIDTKDMSICARGKTFWSDFSLDFGKNYIDKDLFGINPID